MSLSTAGSLVHHSLEGGSPHSAHASFDRKANSLPYNNDRTLVIIDSRALDRECLAQGMQSHGIRMNIVTAASVTEWKMARDRHPPLSAVLVNFGGRRITDAHTGDELKRLTTDFATVPVIVLGDTEDLPQILRALEHGAKGYIPTSVGIDVCIEAIRLALAGGTFLPASSVISVRQLLEQGGEAARHMAGMFTARQTAVVEALRRGKANKIIAYELNLRESTVKVHIRNIMRKLKATNRTEVACKINDLYPATSFHAPLS